MAFLERCKRTHHTQHNSSKIVLIALKTKQKQLKINIASAWRLQRRYALVAVAAVNDGQSEEKKKISDKKCCEYKEGTDVSESVATWNEMCM